MKKILLIILSASLLTGCFNGGNDISYLCFDAVNLGSTVEELECIVGAPYAVHCICDGELEYEYVEKLSVDSELMAENHYFFKVVNGHVVSKYVKVERRPAYDLIYQADPNYPMFPPQAGSY
ncbi:MAG TPA: hypothetical protein VLG76_08255 [Rhabdochlamydiaceae bacterium]|nr:hypothetical protein [Rhabdochlamydiaceae bacterium]